MKQVQRKSFDWYKMQQRFSIRKYHFGAASVLLGTALVLGVGAKAQTVQADEHYAEVTNSVSVDKIAEATKPVEVSTTKKETTYPAPTVVNPVETTPAKTEEATRSAEKVEEPKVEKEEVSHQSAVDKSKLLTALSRAKKLESKLYTEASAAKLRASIQAGQGLLGKADATEAEISAAESSIQSAVIGLELRSNSDKGTVSETPVAKKADADEAEEETKQAPTTNRSALDSVVLPASRTAKVEATSAPKTTNEILKPGLSLSDARQNPAIRKEDLEKGHSGFRAASNPANPIVSGSGNTVAFTDISQSGRSYSFRGYGNARGGHSIHYDVTTVRQGNRLNFTIQYSGPGEFVNNNFILDKGDGFGNPSNATITTPRLREQSKPISQGANFVSHSGYTMTSATETSLQQTIRFSLPINNPNGDLSVRLKPVTFNVDQGGGGAATSNDPYSNSNYYYRANPLYLDANPNGGSSNKVVTEDIDFQTVYLPTSKLPEGQTRLVREGEKGQRQITYKVHRFGNETILGLPISNSVTKEAKPRILQIGVAKELIDTVKPRVDQNKVGDTNNLTFYLDNDGNGVYTEGVDELVQKIAIKDGAKGEKGDQGERGLTGAKGEKGDRGERGLTGAKGEKGDRGERGLTGAKGEKGDQGQAGRDGVTPTVTVKDNKDDGTHTITINDGRGNVTNTIVRDGFDGASPLVATQRNEADKTTTVIFYYDQNDNNEFDAGDTKLKEVVIADGAKGEKGDKGATPKVTTARGADGRSTDITFTVPGEEPVVANIKDGKDGRTPTIDLNALAEAAVRLNNQRSGRVRRALSDAPSTAPAPQPVEGTRITAYYDNNGNGKYDPGVDELIGTSDILNGTNGRNGADGASGTDGRNGAELLSGPKAPTANDGKDGDTYIDATTGDVYKKEGRNWNQIGNIRGPQGLPGPKGDKGENGRDGFTPEVTVTDNHDGTHTITITQPEGRPALTTIVKNGVDGQTPKVKAVRDEAKKQTTLTFYIDKDGDGNYTEGTDTLVQTSIVKDGQDGAAGRDGKEVLNGTVDPQPRDGKDGDSFVNTVTGDVFVKKNNAWEPAGNIKGPKGDKGENGKDGFTPEVSVTDNHDGSHTITITQPEGRPALTTTVKNGVDGQTPKVKAERDEAKKQTTLTFYVDKDGDGNYTEGTDTLVQTSIVKDGEKGEDGKTPEVTVTPGKDGHSSDITFTVPGKDPVTVNVKNGENGLNGKTPKVDLLRVEGKNGNPSHTIVTFYTDENNDGKYTPGTDELLGSEMIKDGAKGADGRDGKSLLTVKEGKETKVYQEDPANPGQPLTPDRPLAVIRDGIDGKSPTVTAARKEEVDHKGVEITVDNHDGSQPTTVFVHDGAKGETGANGQNGQTPTVTTQRGADGHSTVVTITTPGKEPVTFTVRDGLDGHNGNNGRTPKIDLQPYINGEDSFRRARRSVGNNPDEASEHPNSRATSSDNADGTHVTVYFDNNGNNHYDPGVDELISERDVLNGVNGENGASGRDGRNGSELLSGNIAPTPKDGKNGDTYIDSSTGNVYKKQNGAWNKTGNIRGPQGAKGDTPEVTAKPGADGHSTDITITTPGKDPVTVNVKNGKDGKSLIAKKEGNETKIFVEDPANPGQPLDATKPLATVLDGLKGEKGEKGDNGADGKSPVVTMTDNGDGTHSITVRNGDGSESTTKVKDGKDGKTATITTTENPDGSHTITVTNPDGTTKETVVKNGKDGKTPKVEVTDNNDGTHTVKVTDGDGNVTNAIIKDGKDGKAASATTRENPDGSHTVTITNPDGTKNEFVVKNGRDGVDGRTPTASVRDNGDGSHTIVITNPEGVTTETTVHDGKSPKVTITDEQNGTHKISVLNGDGTTTETIIKDGKSPVATIKDNHDGTYTIRVENGNGTVSETTIRDGKSPTAKVVDNGDGTHTITVVNSDGTTTTTTVCDGKAPKLEVIDNNNGSHTIKVTGTDGKETTTTIFDGKSPKANIVDNGDGTHTLTIVDSDGREYKSIIKDGKDGVSPTVTVKNNNDGTHVVTIINPDGSKTEMVIKDGKDGKSPKVSVEDNGNGSHTITIINSDGTVTKTVIKDGKDGRDGRDGKDGKDGKCGCQDKPVTPSNDKPVPPTPNVPERPMFAMPEPPVHELPEYTGGVTPLDPPVYDKPEFNGGVPGMPEVTEVPELDIPTVPAQPIPNVPTPEVPVQPVPAVPEQPVVPTPAQPATPVNANPVVPTTVKENHGDKLPETGSQSDYISVLLGSGILLSLYVGRRKED